MYPQSISFFMPAYNEEKNIASAIEDGVKFLKANFKDYELIVVNDGSKDKTKEIAESYSRENPKIKVINHPRNLQYGRAFKTGFESSTKELIFYTDSDRQFNVNEIHNLMKYISKYDMVIGYRKNRQDKKMRLFYSWLYNLALRFLLNIPFRDIDCAFKICKKKVIDKIRPFTCVRSADSELMGKALAYGFTAKQIPVSHYPRKAGTSEAETGGFFAFVKPSIIIYLIKETLALRLKINKIRAKNHKS